MQITRQCGIIDLFAGLVPCGVNPPLGGKKMTVLSALATVALFVLPFVVVATEKA